MSVCANLVNRWAAAQATGSRRAEEQRVTAETGRRDIAPGQNRGRSRRSASCSQADYVLCCETNAHLGEAGDEVGAAPGDEVGLVAGHAGKDVGHDEVGQARAHVAPAAMDGTNGGVGGWRSSCEEHLG